MKIFDLKILRISALNEYIIYIERIINDLDMAIIEKNILTKYPPNVNFDYDQSNKVNNIKINLVAKFIRDEEIYISIEEFLRILTKYYKHKCTIGTIDEEGDIIDYSDDLPCSTADKGYLILDFNDDNDNHLLDIALNIITIFKMTNNTKSYYRIIEYINENEYYKIEQDKEYDFIDLRYDPTILCHYN